MGDGRGRRTTCPSCGRPIRFSKAVLAWLRFLNYAPTTAHTLPGDGRLIATVFQILPLCRGDSHEVFAVHPCSSRGRDLHRTTCRGELVCPIQLWWRRHQLRVQDTPAVLSRRAWRWR